MNERDAGSNRPTAQTAQRRTPSARPATVQASRQRKLRLCPYAASSPGRRCSGAAPGRRSSLELGWAGSDAAAAAGVRLPGGYSLSTARGDGQLQAEPGYGPEGTFQPPKAFARAASAASPLCLWFELYRAPLAFWLCHVARVGSDSQRHGTAASALRPAKRTDRPPTGVRPPTAPQPRRPTGSCASRGPPRGPTGSCSFRGSCDCSGGAEPFEAAGPRAD